MKLFSGDGIVILSSALLFTGIASATKTNDLNFPNKSVANPTYTASGTMSKRSAILFTNLLRNPHLQVKAEVGRHAAASRTNTVTSPTYTASGRMSKKSALLLTNLLRNPHLQVKAEVGRRSSGSRTNSVTGPTYTASGKMSKKNALLLTNLLRNPHLKVKAVVGQQLAKKTNRPMDISVRYTIKGKTDRQTVLKLKRLLQNNSNIKIIAHANVNLPSKMFNQPSYSQRSQMNNGFIGAYRPFYYNGRPPVYIQGNTIWYPVPVANFAPNIQQAPYPMNYSLDVASK